MTQAELLCEEDLESGLVGLTAPELEGDSVVEREMLGLKLESPDTLGDTDMLGLPVELPVYEGDMVSDAFTEPELVRVAEGERDGEALVHRETVGERERVNDTVTEGVPDWVCACSGRLCRKVRRRKTTQPLKQLILPEGLGQLHN